MAYNPVGHLDFDNPPWGHEIFEALYNLDIDFTGNIISDQGFIVIYEARNGTNKIWIRAVNLVNAPSNYAQKMFPDGFQPPKNDLGDNVSPILDMKLFDNWIFVIIPACTTTLAKINKDQPLCNKDQAHRARDWLSQIICGLTNLLAMGYFHGDLCPENVLIDSNQKIQITGYSLVKMHQHDDLEYYVGPNYRFRPPKPAFKPADKGKPFSGDDVWALGILMYEMLSGEYLVDPGEDMNDYFTRLQTAYENGHILRKIRGHRLLSDEAKDQIERLFITDQAEKPKLGLVADHDYFNPELQDYEIDLSEWDIVEDILQAPRGLEGSSMRIPPEHQLDINVEKFVYKKGIRIKKYLGSGCFGAVYRVKYKEKYLAMKVLSYEKSTPKQLQAEEDIAKNLKHPNVIKLYKVFRVTNIASVIIMELACTDLQKQIEKLGTTTRENADMVARNMRKYLHHYALGLAYCHSKNIAHSDIKPDNCLIRDNDTAAVADFGIATRTKKGSADQLAKFARDVDLYGRTVEDGLRGVNRLTDNLNPEAAETDIHYINYPTLPSFVPDLAKELILATRLKDIKQRPTMAQVAEHPWFTADGPDMPPTAQPQAGSSSELSGSAITSPEFEPMSRFRKEESTTSSRKKHYGEIEMKPMKKS